MHDFTVWVSYGKWRKNRDIRYCLLHPIHLSSTRLRRCGRILSGICEPFCLITPDLTMRYCPILILIDYNFNRKEALFNNKTAVNNRQPLYIFFKYKISLEQLEQCFDTANQTSSSCSRTHCFTNLTVLVTTFFTLQCQLLRYVGTLTSVLFQLCAGKLCGGTVTPSFDSSRVITYSQIANRTPRSSTTSSNNRS